MRGALADFRTVTPASFAAGVRRFGYLAGRDGGFGNFEVAEDENFFNFAREWGEGF